GYEGTELQPAINEDRAALARLEAIRVAGALRMGLVQSPEEALTRQHTPKVAFVAPPRDYVASSGKPVPAAGIDLNVRALSMGKLHHAMMGTASVAIATAAAVPGTLVNLAAGGGPREVVRFGHPSGTLQVGAAVAPVDGQWTVTKAVMSRSALVRMDGTVRVLVDTLGRAAAPGPPAPRSGRPVLASPLKASGAALPGHSFRPKRSPMKCPAFHRGRSPASPTSWPMRALSRAMR